MNHYSFFDTYIISLLPIFDAHICLRSWPFRMFWYTVFMRIAEYYDLESFSWDEIVEKARYVKRRGGYLAIFPEGHRSRTGQPRRFYSGAFKLATQLGIPIIPLCLAGTQHLLPPGRFWLKPAKIQLQLLPPVYPHLFSGERSYVEMRKYVYKQMVDAIQVMGSGKEFSCPVAPA